MALTDRTRIKNQQKGEYLTAAGMVDGNGAVNAMHTRQRDFQKRGTENAATNVAEVVCVADVARKSKLRKASIAVTTNITGDNTNYAIIKFFKRTSGTSTLIASWNTHGGAQSSLTTNVSGHCDNTTNGLVVNSDAEIAAGSQITYSIGKLGSGQLVDIGTCFSFDLEEI